MMQEINNIEEKVGKHERQKEIDTKNERNY